MPAPHTRDRYLAAALSCTVLAVYIAGACRTIYVGDSGELATAVATLGIPHPSGYPLYILLGKLWTLLVPAGTVAFRLSLFSAVCASATVGLLYLTARDLEVRRAIAASAALTAAFAPSFWGEANIQRVYALNALFVVWATRSALAWWRERDTRRLLWTAFLCGLGASNHTFMAVFVLAFGLFVLANDRGPLRRARTLGLTGGAFALGLLPYLYLPLQSRMDPRLDWGNPETPRALLAVILRQEYWDRAWWRGVEDLPEILGDWLSSLGAESLWAGAVLALVGVAWGARRRLPVLLPVFVMASNVAILAVHGSRNDLFIWHRYYIPSYLMLAILAALGGEAIARRSPQAGAVVLSIVLFLLPTALFARGWREFDRSHYRIAEDYSRTLLASLPPGAHLAASDDNVLFVLLYLHLVEGVRPDIDLIPQGVGGVELAPLRFDPARDRLFFTHHPNWSTPTVRVVARGLAFEILAAGTEAPREVLDREALEGERDPRVPKDFLTRSLIGQFHFMRALGFEASAPSSLRRELDLAAHAAPDDAVLLYNLGLVYRRNGALQDALAAFERARELDPRSARSRIRADSPDPLEELRRELGARHTDSP